MSFWWFLIVLLLLAALVIGVRMLRTSSGSTVVDVRRTPQREVEEMTVNQFENLVDDWLESEDWTVVERKGEQWMIERNGETHRLVFDYSARSNDPRYINQLMVTQRKDGLAGQILVTVQPLSGKSSKLTTRAKITVLDPQTLIEWKREEASGKG